MIIFIYIINNYSKIRWLDGATGLANILMYGEKNNNRECILYELIPVCN